jgi:hypothetical protein
VSYPRLNEWMERYEIELVALRRQSPDRFLWEDSRLTEVLDRMRHSFARGPGHFNKDSMAIRATCRHFGIPLTYHHIDLFLKGK